MESQFVAVSALRQAILSWWRFVVEVGAFLGSQLRALWVATEPSDS